LEQEFLKDLVRRIERTGFRYAITGSIASNLWGIPRTTHDVDVVLLLQAENVAAVLAAFADAHYVSEPAVRDAISRQSMFNVIDAKTSLKADFWVAGSDEFSGKLLERRQRVEIVSGQEAFVATAEDVLLHKLVWNEISPSERQLSDAAGIAAVQKGRLDLAYLRAWAAKQGTAAVLEEVLEGKYLKKT
jgi:hypothetical protein